MIIKCQMARDILIVWSYFYLMEHFINKKLIDISSHISYYKQKRRWCTEAKWIIYMKHKKIFYFIIAVRNIKFANLGGEEILGSFVIRIKKEVLSNNM